MPRRLFRFMIFLLLLVPLGYLFLCIYLYVQQDKMVFSPSRESIEESERLAAGEGFSSWRNAAGELMGWRSNAGDPDNVLLVMNGNAGTALDRSHYGTYCRNETSNWKTFLLEYPGYGSREGRPSEESLTDAACEAVDLLAVAPGRRIWLLGESLGSGTASATVRKRPDKIAGVILVTPFNSLVAAAAGHYPWMPVTLLLKTRFASDKNLVGYPGPVAFFLGANDRTVPAVLGQELYDGYGGRKRLWIDPEGTHNVSALVSYEWPELVQWLEAESQKEPHAKDRKDGT
jgi:uncharacterized protein